MAAKKKKAGKVVSKARPNSKSKATRPPKKPHFKEFNPFDVILYPYVTEKTMNLMENLNRLEFLVKRSSTKPDIKKAFENLFEVKVAKINTRILKDGKHAIITLTSEYSAEDIGMRIGIF
ncbi:MAG: 50S ribosomal protein L23 [Thermoplasmata archaeon]|nr:50S ribosomal protein L23 [Thermoplasmata archaeon]